MKVGQKVIIVESKMGYTFDRELAGEMATVTEIVNTGCCPGYFSLHIPYTDDRYHNIKWTFTKGNIILRNVNLSSHKIGAFYV